jgi:hypothetical protein
LRCLGIRELDEASGGVRCIGLFAQVHPVHEPCFSCRLAVFQVIQRLQVQALQRHFHASVGGPSAHTEPAGVLNEVAARHTLLLILLLDERDAFLCSRRFALRLGPGIQRSYRLLERRRFRTLLLVGRGKSSLRFGLLALLRECAVLLHERGLLGRPLRHTTKKTKSERQRQPVCNRSASLYPCPVFHVIPRLVFAASSLD